MSIGFVLFQQFQFKDPFFGIEFYDASVLHGKNFKKAAVSDSSTDQVSSSPNAVLKAWLAN